MYTNAEGLLPGRCGSPGKGPRAPTFSRAGAGKPPQIDVHRAAGPAAGCSRDKRRWTCSCACFSLTLMTCHPPDSSGKAGRAVRELQPVGGSLGRRGTGPASTLRGSGPAAPQIWPKVWGPSAAPAARRQQGGRPGGTRLATSRHSRFLFGDPRGAKNIRGAAPSPPLARARSRPAVASCGLGPGSPGAEGGRLPPTFFHSFFHSPL